jgi:NADH:ubiquinone oxidoreductase subunit E
MSEQIERILADLDTESMTRQQRLGMVLPVLQKIQRALGYLPREAFPQVAGALGIGESQVYGVATFYSQFKFSPPGRNAITVCCGTACHVRGSARLLSDLEKRLGIESGETTPNLDFSLDTIACFGSCALAPVVVINGKVQGRMNRSKLLKSIDKLSSAPDQTEAGAAHQEVRS